VGREWQIALWTGGGDSKLSCPSRTGRATVGLKMLARSRMPRF
jgi:hypothetical protein